MRKFDGISDVFDDVKQVESSLRLLFDISSEFTFGIIAKNNRYKYINESSIITLLDNPLSGERFQAKDAANSHQVHVLDLSYSFPQIENDWQLFNSLSIDSNASLGMPNELLMIFSKEKSLAIDSILDNQMTVEHHRDIYILARVLKDIIEKGMEMLLRESNYKAAVLYQMIESSNHLTPVSGKEKRSKSMVVADCDAAFVSQIEKLGYELYSHKHEGKTRITIANYPTQSKELIEMFADRVATL